MEKPATGTGCSYAYPRNYIACLLQAFLSFLFISLAVLNEWTCCNIYKRSYWYSQDQALDRFTVVWWRCEPGIPLYCWDLVTDCGPSLLFQAFLSDEEVIKTVSSSGRYSYEAFPCLKEFLFGVPWLETGKYSWCYKVIHSLYLCIYVVVNSVINIPPYWPYSISVCNVCSRL